MGVGTAQWCAGAGGALLPADRVLLSSSPAGFFAMVLAVLLLVGGVEPNPGPVLYPSPDDIAKKRCQKFLTHLLELSSLMSKKSPEDLKGNMQTLIQELIDSELEPEEFCVRLEQSLNAARQPCLVGFLEESLPPLRQSLLTKELVIEGIRPPSFA